MRLFYLLIVTTFGFLAGSGCSSPHSDAPEGDGENVHRDNTELAELYQQDQAERQVDHIDWDVLAERDRQRRRRVQELLDADSVITAADYFHAA